MKPEKIKDIIVKIERIQSIMIGIDLESKIRFQDDDYKDIYQRIEFLIETLQDEEDLSISNMNTFSSLGDWYAYWSSNHLNLYARHLYIYELYVLTIAELEFLLNQKLVETLENSNFNILEVPQFKELITDIANLQKIMIDVATGDTKIEDDDETYTKIYNSITSRIIRLKIIGVPITNPNHFRSLLHWKAYWSCELKSHALRKNYIKNLYANIVIPIEQALKRNSLKENSTLEEFIEDLKRFLVKAQSNQSLIVAPKSSPETIRVSDKPNVVLTKDNTHHKEPISNCNLPKEIFVPTDTKAFQSSNVTDVVIITALPKERNAVLAYLDYPQAIQNSAQTFHRASIKTNKPETNYEVVIVCLPAMGSVQAALATQEAIAKFKPSHIILVGIAGGIPKDNSRYLGDILIAEQIVYYELGKQVQVELGKSEINRRYEPYRPAKVLLDAAKNLQQSQRWVSSIKAQRPDGTTGRVIPKAHCGVVASGDKVIADPSLRSELQSDWSQLVGFEMEGGGAAIAAYQSNFSQGILLIKGMCDWGDASKNDDWQEYAAESAAAFVIELLKSAPFESKLKLNIPSNE